MAQHREEIKQLLEHQHGELKTQLQMVQDTGGQERAQAFLALRRLLAAHETAEQLTMHPVLRRAADDTDRVDQRVAEEEEATRVVADLEGLEIGSLDFSDAFAAFAESVVAHAEAEEHEELDTILDAVTEEEAGHILTALREVESVARSEAAKHGSDVSFAELLAWSKQEFARRSDVVGAG